MCPEATLAHCGMSPVPRERKREREKERKRGTYSGRHLPDLVVVGAVEVLRGVESDIEKVVGVGANEKGRHGVLRRTDRPYGSALACELRNCRYR
jgi:hypothetical protein